MEFKFKAYREEDFWVVEETEHFIVTQGKDLAEAMNEMAVSLAVRMATAPGSFKDLLERYRVAMKVRAYLNSQED